MKKMEEWFSLEIDGKKIPARVIRESRRSIRMSTAKEAVVLRLPLQLTPQEQNTYLDKFKYWLEKQAKAHPALLERFVTKDYQDGDTLVVGTRPYLIKKSYSDKKSSSGKLKNGIITLNLSQKASQKTIGNLISRLVAKDYLAEIIKRTQELNARYFRKPINSIVLKNLHSRWGSCSSKGNVNLSTRLLFAPQDVQDYVIIHELAHLVEMNHSPRFWKLVADAMPDYKTKEKWLKAHGEQCRF
ncbi:MAG: M48 family metallopeptidase [Saprospiraceae bacterium]